ncbi:hypothetical protein [Streptomyces scopuliridis]|uniref:hypothetical protein n=1 Tax=Streptomyces scopuliridis TaxID=452529 RepID=UPI0036A8B888
MRRALEYQDRGVDLLSRLTVRDPGRWDVPAVDALLGWAAWHRNQAEDPRYRTDAVIDDSRSRMAWRRWTGSSAGDRR